MKVSLRSSKEGLPSFEPDGFTARFNIDMHNFKRVYDNNKSEEY